MVSYSIPSAAELRKRVGGSKCKKTGEKYLKKWNLVLDKMGVYVYNKTRR